MGNPLFAQAVVKKKANFDDFRQNIAHLSWNLKIKLEKMFHFNNQNHEKSIILSISEK